MRIVLGSASPRRREILNFFALPTVVDPSPFDEEEIAFEDDPKKYVETLAILKGKALDEKYGEEVILTADTVVFLEGDILEKPRDDSHAFEMLQKLSGKTHEVMTGLAVRKKGRTFSGVETTRVIFNPLAKREIQAYLKTNHGKDKAGSYGAQEMSSLMVKGIEGDFYNVLGLPINLLRTLLNNVGIDLWDALYSS